MTFILKSSLLIFTSMTLLSINACKAQNDANATYDYTIKTPENYDANSDNSYPLLIFLHGAGERGEDLEMLGVHGPLKLMKQGKKFDAIVLAPLCPSDVWWDTDLLQKTLEKVKSKYNIDETRIHLTGLSMGGYATWLWAGEYPKQFKNIAPICGGGDIKDAQRLSQIPIWAFHGGEDKVVLPEESQKMIDAIKAVGGNPKFTIYPEADHDSWTETYENEDFWLWLLGPKK